MPELGLYQVGLPRCDLGLLNSAALALQAQPTVSSVKRNYVGGTLSLAFYQDFSSQWLLNAIYASQAWSVLGGKSAKAIGVVDTGVDYTHDYLSFVTPGRDFCASVVAGRCLEGSWPMDTWGHGTGVASLAALVTNRQAPIIAEKVTIPHGLYHTDASVAAAIVHAIHLGARVINLSLATGDGIEKAIDYANMQRVLIVTAAGNDNSSSIQSPGSYSQSRSNVIAVGATDEFNQRAIWTDCAGAEPNAASNFGVNVDLYAPGKDLVLAMRGGEYTRECYAGTSWAAPLVAGVASMMLGVNPQLTPSDVKRILIDKQIATNTGNTDSYYPGGNNTIYLLNAVAAVEKVADLVPKANLPPRAGFLMTSGSQAVREGSTPLTLTVPAGGTAVVAFDGSTPLYSSDPDGNVVSWLWSIDGSQASTVPTCFRALPKGNHHVSLFVGDDKGAYGPAATGSVVVIESVTLVVGRVTWNGSPVASAGVQLKQSGNYYTLPVLAGTTTGSDGRFTLANPPTGSYMIYAVAPTSDYWDWAGYTVTIVSGKQTNVGDMPLSKKLQLLSPANNATFSMPTPMLTWNAVPGTTRYDVVVYNNATSQLVFSQSTTTNTQVTVAPALPVGQYQWSVYADNATGQIAYWSAWCFTVAAPVSVWPMSGHDPQRTGQSVFVGTSLIPRGGQLVFDPGSPVAGDLTISAEGNLYFATNTALYALAPDGSAFASPISMTAVTGPSIDDRNGYVYIGQRNGASGWDLVRYTKHLQNPMIISSGMGSPSSLIIGINGAVYFFVGGTAMAQGPIQWSSAVCGGFGGAPAIGQNGYVYGMCGDGLYRVDGNTGLSPIGSSYPGGYEPMIDIAGYLHSGYFGIAFSGAMYAT